MTYRVIATARSFSKSNAAHHAYLRENGCDVDLRAGEHPYTADELREMLPGYDGAILGLDVCDRSVLEKADSLRVISRYGSGVDTVDLAAATERGIIVTTAPGANTLSVVELAIGLLFALARSLPQVAGAAREGKWRRAPGWELNGKTLGLIGYGAIGREVAARAAALGMTTLAFDPYFRGEMTGARNVDLPTLLAEAHVVTLHCPLTPDTQNIINAPNIALMRDGAYLVNTARGGLVDETALYDALANGKLGGAAMDVFRQDPPTDSPLLMLDNFIATPHIGATTREAVERTAMLSAQNLVAVLRGEPCPYIVNPQALQKKDR
jgi:D-3-phosphoglycerate dehydrogenase